MSQRIPSFVEALTCSRSHGRRSEAPHLWDDLVGYWSGLQGGGKHWYDLSGYDNLGTLTNMDPATDWVATEMGWALDFSAGKDRKVVLPGFSLSGNWTSAFWMWGAENNPGGATGSMVCGKDSDDDFIYCADNLRTRFENSVGANVSWVADNDFYHRWRHCLFAADATGITFYLDGISQGRQAIAPTLALDLLGVAHTNPALDFTGRLASFTLWNRCLLAADAQDLYAYPHAQTRLRRRVYATTVAEGNYKLLLAPANKLANKGRRTGGKQCV